MTDSVKTSLREMWIKLRAMKQVTATRLPGKKVSILSLVSGDLPAAHSARARLPCSFVLRGTFLGQANSSAALGPGSFMLGLWLPIKPLDNKVGPGERRFS